MLFHVHFNRIHVHTLISVGVYTVLSLLPIGSTNQNFYFMKTGKISVYENIAVYGTITLSIYKIHYKRRCFEYLCSISSPLIRHGSLYEHIHWDLNRWCSNRSIFHWQIHVKVSTMVLHWTFDFHVYSFPMLGTVL